MICSGYYIELWEIIILFTNKYINIGNPKISVYIDKNITTFKSIVTTYTNELNLRNNINIRKLFSEIICVLCKSNRKHPFSENKIDNSHYDISNIGDKLKAPNMHFIDNIFKQDDIKECYVGFNELYYNIIEHKNTIMSCYWIDWIINFDILLRKNKHITTCSVRNYINDDKYNQHIIWIVWDIFFVACKNNSFNTKIIQSLLSLFTLKFSTSIPKKRKYILYNCVSLLTENIDQNIPILTNIETINIVHENLNKIYKQLKQNEKKTFDNTTITTTNKKKINKNTTDTMKKLQIINDIT